MRAGFGLIALVVVLAIVGLLVKKQTQTLSTPVPTLQGVPGAAQPAGATPQNVRAQSQQMQQQVKQQMEAMMQQARPMPEEAPEGKN
jgi:conjugal transfer/entry exclusion protein